MKQLVFACALIVLSTNISAMNSDSGMESDPAVNPYLVLSPFAKRRGETQTVIVQDPKHPTLEEFEAIRAMQKAGFRIAIGTTGNPKGFKQEDEEGDSFADHAPRISVDQNGNQITEWPE